MADIKRLNYFNYQFLVENDFTDEQDYHLGMRRRHNMDLHSWGVADGLEVSKTGDKEVTISPGMALDNIGREIILMDPLPVDLTSFGTNANIHLTVAYEDVFDETDRYTSGGVDDYTRTTERPKMEGKTTVPGDGSVIDIALVKLDGSGNVNTIDDSVKKHVGSKIATGTVGTDELAQNAVTREKIAANAVTSDKIANGAVTTADLANSAVNEPKLATGSVSNRTLQNSAVGGNKIADNAITSAKLREADGTSGQNTNTGNGVKTAHIQNGAVSEAKVGDNAVTSSKIREADNSTGQNANTGSGIKSAHIQNQAVSLSKLDSPLQTTVSRAVQNTGGTVTGNFHVNGQLSSNRSVSGTSTAYGVSASGSSTGTGTVFGTQAIASGTGSGTKYGINAQASAATGAKYAGNFYANTSGTGTEVTRGIMSQASSNGSGAVYGIQNNASGNSTGAKYGVYSRASGAKGHIYGGYFNGSKSSTGSETTYGIFASGSSTGTGAAYGVRGHASGSGTGGKFAVYGSASGSGTAYAGYFAGRVHISGPLTKPSGSFLIDHVLDPKNKTLRHSFVESPEDLCLYRGKVKLNARGEATVKMPDYFGALTKEEEATITLTPIGRKPFLAGYEWNRNNTAFTIYGEPSREVTYIVLADRDDPAMRHFRRPVEEPKGDGNFEKGKLIHPEAYGEPPEAELEPETQEAEDQDKEVAALEAEQKKLEKTLTSEEKKLTKLIQQLNLEETRRLKKLGVSDQEIESLKGPQEKSSTTGKKKTQKNKKK
jgi:hypothetical protein